MSGRAENNSSGGDKEGEGVLWACDTQGKHEQGQEATNNTGLKALSTEKKHPTPV